MRSLALLLVALCCIGSLAVGQMVSRTDAVWARVTANPITLDGMLSEPAWAVADSIQLTYGQAGPMPGSGWSSVFGPASDPNTVTLKWLVQGDSLYMAAIVSDSSVGGTDWEKFDTFLMSIRKHELPDRPSPSFEYFYGWIGAWNPASGAPGDPPAFFGHAGGNRTDSTGGVPNWQIWDAVTYVRGLSNSDTTAGGAPAADTGYTVEFKFNLAARGYNVSAGDIVEMTITMSDIDWQFPVDTTKNSSQWMWLQGRWGGDPFFNVARIYIDPSVTTSSGAAPAIDPDVVIPNGSNHPVPVVDGVLDESVWANIPGLQLAYGDDAVRNAYPGIGPYRSGQMQPTVNGTTESVLDPASAKVKYFFRGDTIYFAFDVADLILTRATSPNLREWVRVTVNHRDSLNSQQVQQALDLTVTVVDTGAGYVLGGYLPDLVAANSAWVGVNSMGVFNDDAGGTEADTGYVVELGVDLTKLGYPVGRGDGVLFFGVALHDGDSASTDPAYANKVWFFREGQASDQAPYKNGTAPAWAYMDPAVDVPTGVDDVVSVLPTEFSVVANYPNPFNPSTIIRYTVHQPGTVKMFVYDLLGRRVATLDQGLQLPGVREITFSPTGLSSGIYFYVLELTGSQSKAVYRTSTSKMVFIK